MRRFFYVCELMEQAEQDAIASFEAKRADLYRICTDMMGKAVRESQTLETGESQIFDETVADIEAIDAHIKRLKKLAALRTEQ